MVEHRAHVDRAIGGRLAFALELREHEQIGDDVPHPRRLLLHQFEIARALVVRQRQLAHRLEKARQHGKRRLQFVRHVRDEVAPHRIGALELGDILREQQLAVLAVRKHLHGKHVLPIAAHAAHHERFVVMLAVQIADEIRMAHEMRDVLAQVALRVEPEVHLGDRVAPLDLIAIVEHRDAVRRRLDRLDETRVLLLDLAHLRVPLLREFVQPIVDLAPDARRARHFAVDGRIEQAPEALRVEGADETLHDEHREREDETRHGARDCADDHAHEREQHERHQKARPDDVHDTAPDERENGWHDAARTPRAARPLRVFREPVAAAAHGFDHSIAAGGLERGAQPLDVHVDRALLDEHMVAPDLIEQLRAAVHALRMGHEEVQQAELGRAEIELDLAAVRLRGDAMRRRIEPQPVDRHDVLGQLRRAAAQHRLDPRHQLLRRERLRHVIVRADLEAEDLVLLVAARGQHDDRNVLRALVVAQVARERDARFARQHPVEQHQIGQHVADQTLRLLRVVSANRAVTRVLKIHRNQFGNRGFIFDDENVAGHRHLGPSLSAVSCWLRGRAGRAAGAARRCPSRCR
ncbi:hypothetical protein BURPS1710b_1624 [Burkholderia pseudomallei 1710b]|uniref:Uncharacterized protein n=1 Tax=Burkholderia pseudomallei (strain 1710b) TaxID=320372 RepID=Q3JTS6_BURP1|nr:hypothetical protein BURPS1710b_1624 [Burkholderia pseudomallei 1710b]